MGHDSITLAVFNADADQRMVWAVHREDPARLVYVHDDEVDAAYRAWTKATLGCIVPGCTVPLTAAHRSTKRDGFVHLATPDAATHTPESVLHQQGKAALISWVRAVYPDVTINPEVPLEGGVRRPDVLAVSPAGNRIAFEVQYASLTVEAWQRRHDWYVEHDIADVWLFGHTGTHLNWLGGGVRLNAVQDAVIDAGLPVWWINPVDGTLAWAGQHVRSPRDPATVLLVPATGSSSAHLTITAMTEARLSGDGLRTDAYTDALRARDRLRALLPPQPSAPRMAPAPFSVVDVVERLHPQPIGVEGDHKARWDVSPLRARLNELYGDRTADLFVDYPEVPCVYVGFAHEHWQAATYLHAIDHARPLKNPARAWIDQKDLAAGLDALELRCDPRIISLLLANWSGVLHRRGVFAFSRISRGRGWFQGALTALAPAGSTSVDDAPAAAPLSVKAPASPGVPRMREFARGSRESRERPYRWRPEPVVDPRTVPPGHCLGCRLPLTADDIAAGFTRHRKWGCSGPM